MTDDVTRPYDPQPAHGQPRRLGLRGGLRRLSQGLIAYGIVGLLVAAIGLGAMVWVNGRLTALGSRLDVTVAQLAGTMERTATVLHDASTTAESFIQTVDQSALAVTSAAATITEVRSGLTGLESQLRAVSILGSSPLGSTADAVSRINTSLEGLDTRLLLIGEGLTANRGALAANATSLDQLGDSMAALAGRLRSGVVEESLDDVQVVIGVMLLLFAAWSTVPALGALALGIWLRSELGVSGGRA